jgi:hypothetical protein
MVSRPSIAIATGAHWFDVAYDDLTVFGERVDVRIHRDSEGRRVVLRGVLVQVFVAGMAGPLDWATSLFALNRKSTVLPSRFTARYR